MGPVAPFTQGRNAATASSAHDKGVTRPCVSTFVGMGGRGRRSAPVRRGCTIRSDKRRGREFEMEAGEVGADGRMRIASVPRWMRARYAVLLSLSLMYFIAYIDRTNISVAAPFISKELGLDKAAARLHLLRLRLSLHRHADHGRLARRPFRAASHPVPSLRHLVGRHRPHRHGGRRDVARARAPSRRDRRGRRLSGRDPRHDLLVSAARARPRARGDA